MILNINNQCAPNFRAIQLSAKEAEKAGYGIQRLLDLSISAKERQCIKNSMFNIFNPHLQKEARYKTTHHIFEEVLAEMYLKFSELLDDIKNCPALAIFVDKLNKYRPSKDTLKSEYIHQSLDTNVYWDNTMLKKVDTITSGDLPMPKSSVYLEQVKNKIEKAIKQENLPPAIAERIDARLNGIKYKDIAQKENISKTSAQRSVKMGILKIRYNNSNLPEKYIKKANMLANILGCKSESIIKAFLKAPTLFDVKPETIMQNVKKLAEFLNCAEEKIIKMALKTPCLFIQKPETIMSNIEASATILGCPNEVYIKSGFKSAPLLYFKPETIKQNIHENAENFGCSESAFAKTALRHPDLLCRKPEVLKENLLKITQNLGCTKEEIVKAFLFDPSALSLKPDTVINNVKESAKVLKCSEKDFIDVALKCPKLFIITPKTLMNKVKDGSKNFKCSEFEFIKRGFTHPHLFTHSIESLGTKLEVENYYRKIKNEPLKTIPCKISDKVVYTRILAYLIQRAKIEGVEDLVKRKKSFNPEEFIKKFANKDFTFEIPEDNATEAFVKYVQESSIKAIGKNIFNFRIISNNS